MALNTQLQVNRARCVKRLSNLSASGHDSVPPVYGSHFSSFVEGEKSKKMEDKSWQNALNAEEWYGQPSDQG